MSSTAIVARAARRARLPVACAVALLALAAGARAETATLGTPLPASEVVLAICQPCTVFQSAEPGATVTAPFAGSVTSWSYQSGDKGAEYELEVLHPTGGGAYGVSARSARVTVPDANPTVKTVTLASALPIQAGDSLGLHVLKGTDVPTSGTATAGDQYGEIPFDAPGTASFAANQRILMQATVVSAPSGGEGGGSGGGGTGGGGTGGAAPPPAPTVSLTPLRPTTPAGTPLLFNTGVTTVAGQQIARYEYSFSGGASASCAGTYPTLSAVFGAAASGTLSVTAVTTTGVRSLVSSTPFRASAPVRGKRGRRANAAFPLVAYTCSTSPATSPQNTKLGRKLPCLFPSVTKQEYIEIYGCLSLVDFSQLPEADRREAPLRRLRTVRAGHVPSGDPTHDLFYAASAPVHVNGLIVAPQGGDHVVFAHADGSETYLRQAGGYFLFGGNANVSLGTEGTPLTLPVSSGPFDWDVSLTSNGTAREASGAVINGISLAKAAIGALPGIGGLAGQVIEAIPAGVIEEAPDSNAPVSNHLAFQVRGGHRVTAIPINLVNLPFAAMIGEKTGLHVDITLTAENDQAAGPSEGQPKLNIGDFALTIPEAFVGPLPLRNISIHYSRLGDPAQGIPPDAFVGKLEAQLAGGTFEAKVRVAGGQLQLFHIQFVGSQQIVPPEIFLTKASLDLNVPKLELAANAHVSVFGGSIADGCGVGGAAGEGQFILEPFLISLAGAPEVMCIPSPTAPGEYFRVDGNGYVTEGAFINFELPNVGSLKGNLAGVGYFDLKHLKFHMRFDGDGTADVWGLGGGAQLLVSDEGLAACGEVSAGPWTWHPGIGAEFDLGHVLALGTLAPPTNAGAILAYLAGRMDFKTDGCDVNKYSAIPASRIPGSAAAAAAGGPAYSFSVPAHERAAILLLHGAGGAPGAILHGPGGRTIEVPASAVVDTPSELVIHLPRARETEVEIAGANAGSWTVEPLAGAPAIESAELSHELAPPKITGHVSGHGTSRVLRYRMSGVPPGTSVTFVEEGNGGGGAIGTARGSRGSLRFTPSSARTGARSIVALLTAPDGAPRPSVLVARYSAAQPRPGKPAHVRVRRAGNALRITFSPASGATRQYVSALLSDGRTPSFSLGARARSVTIAHVPRKVRALRVLVRGAAGGLLGPRAGARG